MGLFSRGTEAKGRRVKTPTMLQMEPVECGAASLGIVLSYYGLWLPLEKLRSVCGVNRDGSSMGAIFRAARSFGCQAHGYRWSVETVCSSREAYPLILYWEFTHFLVLEGIKGDKVYLNDPAVGHRIISLAEFRQSYTGMVLVIEPGPEFRPAGQSYSILRALYEKLGQDPGAVCFMLAVGLCLVAPGLALPAFRQLFLDDILTGKHSDWIFSLLVAMALSAFVTGTLTALRAWCLTRWQKRLTLLDSSRFFRHLLQLPMTFFQQRFSSEIASRLSFHSSIASVLSDSAATAVLDLLVALFFLLLLFHYSVPLTVVGVGFSFLNAAVFFFLRKRLVELNMRIQQDMGKEYGTAMNGLMIIETLKANGSEADFFNKWASYHTKVLIGNQESQILSQTTTMLPLLLSGVNAALIMTVGGFSIMDGVMTAGVFVAFQNLMGRFQEPMNRLLELGQSLQSVEMQMRRLDDVYRYEIDKLNFPTTGEAAPDKDLLTQLSGKLTLEGVSFGYSPLKAPLIADFSLHMEPGQWVAVVGASGSGKSTVAKIVTGLYEEWSGQVLFDDMPRRQIPRFRLIHSVASVDQEIYLLSGTVRDNITLFNPMISQADVVRAAQDACIHDDIMRLDAEGSGSGYNAHVSEGGTTFSGGQRQRIEIARALAGNPSLLVLDEATSALDAETEGKILTNIRRRGCSCLIIAHRLSTVREADEIIVLAGGRIAERGRHEDLLEKGGVYARLIEENRSETE